MGDHTDRHIVIAIDRLRRGIITRAEASAELLTFGLGVERVRAALLTYDRTTVGRTANEVTTAAVDLVTALEALRAAPDRIHRAAAGDAEDRLIEAVTAHRATRPQPLFTTNAPQSP